MPWVTFVHGAGGSSTIWYKQLKAFSTNFNVLLIDLRGHGRSKAPIYERIKNYNFSTIGDEVLEVLDHLKIQSTHWIGISLGTIIIRDITERHPQRSLSMIMGGAVMKLNKRGQVLMRTGAAFKSVIPYMVLYKFFAWVIMPKKTHKEARNLDFTVNYKVSLSKSLLFLIASLVPFGTFYAEKKWLRPIGALRGEH